MDVNWYIKQRLVHEVHTSERKSYRGCRRRWNWIFQEFYYPQVTVRPLEFGVAFHEAMEVLYNPDTWGWDRQIVENAAVSAFVKKCDAQKQKYLDAIGEQYLTNAEINDEYNDRIELGKGMIHYYWNQVAPKYDNGWKPLKVEIEFMVPIQNPTTNEGLLCKCNRCRKIQFEYWLAADPTLSVIDWFQWEGLPVVLAGRIDMLAEDEHGSYWIVDWKTAARLSRGDTSGQDRDEFLELDDQIESYVMALRRKLGINVRGFIYVELKKSYPIKPERNKVARLGRWFSVNKNQSVDYTTYLDTVKEEDPTAYAVGLYDDFLEYLKNEGERFHGRYQILKTDEELEMAEYRLWQEAQEMTNVTTAVYPSPGRFNCASCAFRQPCLEYNRKGDYQYLLDTLFDKREKHYWVKELSTDKQGGE